jgi:hypothetical protein
MGNNLTQNTTYGPQGSADGIYRRAKKLRGVNNPLEHEECKAVVAELNALSRPATNAEIVQHLAVLLASVPNAVKDDASVRILAEDVLESAPSLGVLELGCRTLRRNRASSFQPTINEVLKALARAARERRELFWGLGKQQVSLECSASEMFDDPDDPQQATIRALGGRPDRSW